MDDHTSPPPRPTAQRSPAEGEALALATPPRGAGGPGHYIRGFDGLRAIAVTLVIGIHLGAYDGKWAPYGALSDGVAIFFVLSGFLITRILLNDTRRSLARFFTRRMIRLYPALLLYLGGVWVFDHQGWAVVPTAAYVTGVTYISNYAPFTAQARETSHLWSLAVEEQFYLVWPLVIFWARRIAIPLAAAGIVAAWWLRVYPPINPTRYMDRQFIPAADSILIGCIAALAYWYWPRRTIRPEFLWAGALLWVGPRWAVLPFFTPLQNAYALLEVQRIGVALVVVWIAGNQSAALVRALEVRPLRYLGRISYGIYLWQGLFVRNGPSDPAGWFHRWPYNVICVVVAAVVSFELVERRFLRLKDRGWLSPLRDRDDDPVRTGTTGTGVRPVRRRPATTAAAAVDRAGTTGSPGTTTAATATAAGQT